MAAYSTTMLLIDWIAQVIVNSRGRGLTGRDGAYPGSPLSLLSEVLQVPR